MSELNRREFVAIAAVGACACCAAADVEGDASSQPSSQPAVEPFDAGALAEFAADGIFDKFRKDKKVILYRQENKLYASTANCSHKRCLLMVLDGEKLKCPCHGSEFDINGVPTVGPAKLSLFRYGVASKDGRVIVDPTVQFAESNWQDVGASIDLTKPA